MPRHDRANGADAGLLPELCGQDHSISGLVPRTGSPNPLNHKVDGPARSECADRESNPESPFRRMQWHHGGVYFRLYMGHRGGASYWQTFPECQPNRKGIGTGTERNSCAPAGRNRRGFCVAVAGWGTRSAFCFPRTDPSPRECPVTPGSGRPVNL